MFHFQSCGRRESSHRHQMISVYDGQKSDISLFSIHPSKYKKVVLSSSIKWLHLEVSHTHTLTPILLRFPLFVSLFISPVSYGQPLSTEHLQALWKNIFLGESLMWSHENTFSSLCKRAKGCCDGSPRECPKGWCDGSPRECP